MSTPKWIYYIDDDLPVEINDPKTLLGGKGACLNDMRSHGLPVPPAFTLTTECCKAFFDKGNRWPDELEEEIRNNLKRLEEETGRRFGAGEKPLLVSVRSGAAKSMPGMMDTLLNCGIHAALADSVGNTPSFWHIYLQFIEMFAKTVAGLDGSLFEDLTAKEKETFCKSDTDEAIARYEKESGRTFPTDPWKILVECIECVFLSWNNDRAIAYRTHNDIRGLVGTAVNIQVMFPSEVSGILFTQDPNGLDTEHMVVEASYGLGEAIVSGDVTPDRFVVAHDDYKNVDTTMGSKVASVRALGDTTQHKPQNLSLTPEQIEELCKLATRVEHYSKTPIDLEWGIADGTFALLQSRAIRGLDIAMDVEVGRLAEIERLKELAGGQRRVWVTHNLAETLSNPTPLTWDLIRTYYMGGNGAFGSMYQAFGYHPSERVKKEGFLELICGRIYADPDRLAELFSADMPMVYDLESILRSPAELEKAPGKFDPEKVDETFLLKLPRVIRSLLRCSRTMKKGRADSHIVFEKEKRPQFLRYLEEKKAQDLTALSVPELLPELKARSQSILCDFASESLIPGFFGGGALDQLTEILSQLSSPHEGAALANTLTSGLDGDITFEQNALLYRIAHGEATREEFIEKFAHRALGEMELAVPRWREDSDFIDRQIESLRTAPRSPEEIHHSNIEKRKQAQAELSDRLAEWGGSSFREEIDEAVEQARKQLPYRETGKYYLMMGFEQIRLLLLELSNRWNIGNDIFYLHLDELPRFAEERDALLEKVEQRKLRWKSFQRLDMPDVIDSRQLDALGLSIKSASNSSEWNGEPVAAGVSVGIAKIIHDPATAGNLGENYILVCPSTDPGWTPLFINARGVIVEKGGTLSHGAIVARDFGIPCVVLPGATQQIADGASIKVDGNQGVVTALED